MHGDPALLQPVIPGIRNVFHHNARTATAGSLALATPLIPARSILRSLFFAGDVGFNEAFRMRLQLAFVNTITPVASDFTSGNRILPNLAPVGLDNEWPISPESAADPISLNFQLPPREGRLILLVVNTTPATVAWHLRLVIDGLGRLGADDGRR